MSYQDVGSESLGFTIVRTAVAGLVMGCVHVLTGPDHLSALATLSANVGNGKAFALGVQWGIGHSTGFLTVALILVLTTDSDGNLDVSPFVGHLLESFVGFFMLGLGSITLFAAIEQRRVERITKEGTTAEKGHLLEDTNNSPPKGTTSLSDSIPVHVNSAGDVESLYNFQHQQGVEHVHITSSDGNELVLAHAIREEKRLILPKFDLSLFMQHSHAEKKTGGTVGLMVHTHDYDTENAATKSLETLLRQLFPCCCQDVKFELNVNAFPGKVVAFSAGILHGLAGTGGILGVIPAMHMKNWKLACLYLAFFCLSSIVVMGTFAALYGNISKALSRAGNADFYLECFSSSLSIIVGVTWLTLLSLGKLEQVFG